MKRLTREAANRFRADPMLFFASITVPTATGNHKFSDIWADFQQAFFRAVTPALIAVSQGKVPPFRGYWLERTKGASKDSDVGLAMLWLLNFSTRRLSMEAGADDQPQILETHDSMQEIAHANEWMRDRIRFLRSQIVCDATRSRLRFLTADKKEAKRKHGSRPDVTLCNELSHVENKGFILTMLDNADKVPTNLRMIATNAGEVRTWQHEWRERYKHDKDWWFQKVDYPAPWIDKRQLVDAELRSTIQRYNRLWKGVWVSGDSEQIDTRDVQACMRRRRPMTGKEDGYIFVAGLDLGVKHDHSALVTLGAKLGSGTVRLARCRSWKPSATTGKVDLTVVRKACMEEYQAFRHIWVGYDPNQAELMAQDLLKCNLPMNELSFTPKNLDQMARDILSSFRARILELYEDWELIEDLHRLQIVEKKFGMKIEAISDDRGHADRAIAFAIALPLAIILAQYKLERTTEDDFGQFEGVTV